MKIYAESQIVEVPTYSHVGYLATKTFHPHYPILSVGLLLLLIGALISGELKFVRSRKSSRELTPKARKLRKIGARLAVVGFCFGFLSMFPFGKSTWDAPNSISESHTEMLSTYIMEYICEMKTQGKDVEIPGDLKVLKKLLEPYSEYNVDIEDGWYNPMKVGVQEFGRIKFYSVTSAGKDGKFGTEDDIVYPKTDEQRSKLYLKYLDATREIWTKQEAQTRENSE